jgi:hypothetical protein
MVELYELEKVIEDEKTERIWDSIDEDFLNECEKHKEWYLDFTKKEEHPMAYEVKKEIEEWAQSAPLLKEYKDMQQTWLQLCVGYMFINLGIGIALALYIWS